MTWNGYKAGVAIAAGLSVTGVLWWQAPGPRQLKGEDVAELQAGALERCLVPEESETPLDGITNRVGFYLLWEDIYDKVLVPVRAAALEGVKGTGRMLWLAPQWPEPVEGDTIYACDAGQRVTESYYTETADGWKVTQRLWGSTAVTNVTERVATLGTRHGMAGYRHEPVHPEWYGELLTNCPAAWALWEISQTGRTPEWGLPNAWNRFGIGFAWEHGNWWEQAGLGTNAYAYWCENFASNATVNAAVTGQARTLALVNLEQARCVMTNMARSVYFSRLPVYGTNAGDKVEYRAFTDGISQSGAGPYDLAARMAEALGDWGNYVVTTNGGYGDPLEAWVQLKGTRENGENPTAYDGTEVYGDMTWGHAVNCTVGWPSRWAYAAGYVKAVTVYRLVGPAQVTAAESMPGLMAYASWALTGFEPDTVQPGACNGIMLGMCSDVANFSRAGVTGETLAQSMAGDTVDYDETAAGGIYEHQAQIGEFRLEPLVERVADPVEPPVFELGSAAGPGYAYGLAHLHGNRAEWAHRVYGYTYAEEHRGFEARVRTYGFVTVVEWGWGSSLVD